MVIASNSNLLGKITILLIVCFLVIVSFVVNTATALDGSGTEEDPWRIKSLEDFNDFAADANYWVDYTRLETDVNLAGMVYDRAVIAPDVNNSVYQFDGISFTGVFDGNDHKITNLTIDDSGAGNYRMGLFGRIDDGQVSNLGIEGGSISGYWRIGGLVGENSGSVSNCYSTGDVDGIVDVGGLVGKNDYDGIITNCYSTGFVSGDRRIGDLVGLNVGSVSNCYSTGDVDGTGNIVGGLVGWNNGSVSNCYSTGDVDGVADVGGLVGLNDYDGIITNCYSIGNVSGNENVGGLVGKNILYVWASFWDIDTQTHGVTESIGDNTWGIDADVHGLPTSQLHQQSTFTNWDFIGVWNIGENQTYPYLRTVSPGDINKDHITNFLDLGILCNQWLTEP